ncbi:hypothetical protein BC937DRAFT_86212 [Endogone sp. FLAS-F59071]|nr:hypothetical protein BC937DRAFT_86212 [Endogone sp. FLAS-F59071]|eukprot:RUS13178.1 hypothetical protein BC937DRAFT_86212 [Endogone sp. FLAS-F59071]
MPNCSSIFVGGANGTLIKLPDGCGRSPFARVVDFVPMTKEPLLSLRKRIEKEKYSVYELTVRAYSHYYL